VRLGCPLRQTWDSPEGWIATLREHGFRAAYWPLGEDADAATVRAYADAAHAADVVIAEIGAWQSNPISPDDATRARAIDYGKTRLQLADDVGARCCVNVAGSRGDTWDGPHPDNFSADTFALIVDTVREIVDAVAPRRAAYTLETMPWMPPDSADCYLELLRAIDRPHFAVHLDPANLVTSPRAYFDTAALLRECFAKLGPHIRVVHARDVALGNELTVRISEVRPGLGGLDYRVFLTETAKLDPDTPILVEHLTSEAEYRAAVAHVRGVADSLGLQT
jgi:sugar phosphate isomerase/epimerase